MRLTILLLCLLGLFSCQNSNSSKEPAAVSFQGKPLYPLEESPATIQKKDSLLAIAKANYDANPEDLDNIIWYGRRLAYLYRYKEAIIVYTRGMITHPKAAELYRHRGHRYISTRQLDRAIKDFEIAARVSSDRPIEIEPDGLPNKLNQPLSTLQFNIWYHWALAYYLKHDFEKAATLYDSCMHYSTNPDLLTATADWQYMTYRRLNQPEKAAAVLDSIYEGMEIIENESYYNRLLMYKGLKEPSDLLDLSNNDPEAQLDIVTQGYGVGNWYLYNGDKAKAKEVFDKVLSTGYWPAFGYIAAEAEQ